MLSLRLYLIALTNIIFVKRKVLHRLAIVSAAIKLSIGVQVLLKDDRVLVSRSTCLRIFYFPSRISRLLACRSKTAMSLLHEGIHTRIVRCHSLRRC